MWKKEGLFSGNLWSMAIVRFRNLWLRPVTEGRDNSVMMEMREIRQPGLINMYREIWFKLWALFSLSLFLTLHRIETRDLRSINMHSKDRFQYFIIV